MKKLLILLITSTLGLILFGSWLSSKIPPRLRSEEIFPQNQQCQAVEQALLIRFPAFDAGYRTVKNKSGLRRITNCERLFFAYFLSDKQLTSLRYYLTPSGFYSKRKDNTSDLIVHVGHVQPASSIQDPTLLTNSYLLDNTSPLLKALAKFDGKREASEHVGLDNFYPHMKYPDRDTEYFISNEYSAAEVVGRCRRTPGRRAYCTMVVFSDVDGLAFDLIFPARELHRHKLMIQTTLKFLRNWRTED